VQTLCAGPTSKLKLPIDLFENGLRGIAVATTMEDLVSRELVKRSISTVYPEGDAAWPGRH
jgi:hypothetical protein